MIQWKKGAIVKLCLVLIVIYKILPRRNSHREKHATQKVVQNFFTETPRTGCAIPNYMEEIKYFEPKYNKIKCGQRVVHIKHVSSYEIAFTIDQTIDFPYNMSCGYAELNDLEKDTKGIVSRIIPFTDGEHVRLRKEVLMTRTNKLIFVICSRVPVEELRNRTEYLPHPTYADLYVLFKKIRKKQKKRREDNKSRLNVLLLGMEYMSRGRAHHDMPKLMNYFERQNWLDFKFVHRVSHSDMIQNLLTGKAFQKKLCKNLDICRPYFLWYKYSMSGFMTAMGEDVQARNSFIAEMANNNFTDHYLNISVNKDNPQCFGRISAGQQLLDYAFQFVKAYKKRDFFGLFWSRSFSCSSYNVPSLFQHELMNLFRGMQKEGLLSNTFILFFGDQGSAKQTMYSKEGYYDSRLPAFFLWVPFNFRYLYRQKYENLILNQNRLVTHYDMHVFLREIPHVFDNYARSPLYDCRTCVNMFEEISVDRTCSDANITEDLCACQDMVDPGNDEGPKRSLYLALTEIASRMYLAQYRIPRTICIPLTFDRVLRIHSYKRGNKTYFVTAGAFNSGNVTFESVVERTNEGTKQQMEYHLISLRSLTDTDNGINCVYNNDPIKEFCVCKYLFANES